MTEWVPPPEFAPGGKPPPVSSSAQVIQESYLLHKEQHSSPSGLDAIRALVMTPLVPRAFWEARKWLRNNLGEESVTYAVIPAPPSLAAPQTTRDLRKERMRKCRDLLGRLQSGNVDLVGDKFAKALLDLYGLVELRRFQHLVFWQRHDPTIQLPPGASQKISRKTTFGISISDARDLSTSLGLSAGVPSLADISSQINSRVRDTLTLSAQHESVDELTLTNDRQDVYRRYAIWRQVHVLEVARLGVDPTRRNLPLAGASPKRPALSFGLRDPRQEPPRIGVFPAPPFIWWRQRKVEFMQDGSASLTYADVKTTRS